MERDSKVMMIRPDLQLDSGAEKRDIEWFQNKTLRPILKFQNDVLLFRFQHDALTLKSAFSSMSEKKKSDYIEHRIKADKNLQKELIGMVSGMFSLGEFEEYWKAKQELDRRILTMIAKRLIDQQK